MRDWQKWAKAAGIRAVKTMAETAVAMIPVSMTIQQVDWVTILGTAALSGVVSLLLSVKGLPEVQEDKKGEENK